MQVTYVFCQNTWKFPPSSLKFDNLIRIYLEAFFSYFWENPLDLQGLSLSKKFCLLRLAMGAHFIPCFRAPFESNTLISMRSPLLCELLGGPRLKLSEGHVHAPTSEILSIVGRIWAPS